MTAAVVWVGWLVLFLVYELYAAKSEPKGDTFSENVWSWFGVKGPRRPLAWLRRIILAGFLIALAGHLAMGWTVVPVAVFGILMVLVIIWALWREHGAALLVLLALPWLLGAGKGCSIGWPWPTPTPSPTPTATPAPTPTPTPPPTTPPPTPSPIPTPVPTPTQPPPAGCSIDGPPGAPLANYRNVLGAEVNAAMAALRPDCQVGGTCLLGDEPLQAWMRRVAVELRRRGLCAGQHEPGVTDELAVATTAAAPREGWHVAAGNDSPGPVPPGGVRRTVVWAPGAARGAYAVPAAPSPSPTPGPTPTVAPTPTPGPTVEACAAPRPPALAKIKVKVHMRTKRQTLVDSTPLIGPDAAYCRLIGYTDGRSFCPTRTEGQPDRGACEHQVMVEARWSGPAGSFVNDENWLQWIVPRGTGGLVKLCGGPTGAICGSIEVEP